MNKIKLPGQFLKPKKEKKMKQIKTLSIITIILSLSLNMYGFYVSNQCCKVFPNQCNQTNDGNASNQRINIDQLIIKAAGNFLQSNSDYQMVLKCIELSETGLINYALDQAIQNMSMANALYFDIWATSLTLNYDPIVIEKLSQFDFTGYQIKNSLNPTIFKQVESFLKQGHVKELFKKHFEDSSIILKKLEYIQKQLEYGKNVDISNYWRLNQLFLEFAFFGQYTSEVFINL